MVRFDQHQSQAFARERTPRVDERRCRPDKRAAEYWGWEALAAEHHGSSNGSRNESQRDCFFKSGESPDLPGGGRPPEILASAKTSESRLPIESRPDLNSPRPDRAL